MNIYAQNNQGKQDLPNIGQELTVGIFTGKCIAYVLLDEHVENSVFSEAFAVHCNNGASKRITNKDEALKGRLGFVVLEFGKNEIHVQWE